MAFQLQPGSGSLFTNDKEGNEKRPDLRGDINIDGKNYRIAGWWKEGKKGQFISLKVDDRAAPDVSSKIDGKPRTKGDDYRAAQSGHKPSAPAAPEFFDDDIPFS